jgi:hypothetical protein
MIAVAQGQSSGRCMVTRRAWRVSLAATWRMRYRRRLGAQVWCSPSRVSACVQAM